ncbi:hypothetical protein ACT4S2_12065 [Kocuria turfanensis]|uniref:hypothetical protein n=1 Tax=Kocuria turfanensis TaxID=388357 RepID=UPI004035257C
MSTQRRLTAASAAAALGLFLAGCDNTETEETPEAPAETTTAPMEEATTTAPTTGQTGMGDDATTDTGAEGTSPEGNAGGDAGGAGTGADTDAEAGTDN